MKLLRAALLGLFCCLLPAKIFAAGTIFGLPLSQQFTANGEPMSGGKLYIYAAGTSTPSTVYESFSLTAGTEHPHPMVLDSAGRIPEFWLADGSYRVRLTDSAGNEIFDISSTTALGASSGSGGGSGSVEEASIFQAGDIMWQPVNATRTGWVRANGRTIGSSSSGATERANADTETLFLFLWNNFSNSLCAVSGGRGASAAADWAANKTIATLDMRGRLPYGMDTMGNSAALVVAAATSAGGALGQEELAIAQANFPNVNFSHSMTAATHTHIGGGHTHTHPHTHGAGSYAVGTSITNGSSVTRSLAEDDGTAQSGGGANVLNDVTFTSDSLSLTSGAVSGTSASGGSNASDSGGDVATAASGALTVSGTVNSGGSGTAFDTLSPGRAGSWFFRL